MKETLRKWWEGTYVPPPKNDPNSRLIFISLGTYKRSWSSRAAHAILDFLRGHWQWTIGVVLAIFFGFWRR